MNITDPEIMSTPRIRAYATVSVCGRLDKCGIARLRTELAGWRAAGAIDVHLDLSGMLDHDPGLARTLAWAQTQLHGNGGNLLITGANEQLCAELHDAVTELHTQPGWHDQWPGTLTYRPETADQP
ncbi:hypothetical protein BKA01_008166 [Pseudonocardia eucalypti]|nr:hypothetical protein [Pseudonocardia eucalypti]MBB6380889.1 hypothetical protein [Pseudonocardia eucalypti]